MITFAEQSANLAFKSLIMKNILVPVGSSKNAQSLLQYAVDFAHAFNANLYVVQVYNVYTKAGTMIKIDHILERESKAFLEAMIAKVDTKGVNVMTRVLKGKLVDTLDLVCRKGEIDLIIVEPRTTSESEEVFLGQTTGKIVKQTHIPTLIVPERYTFKPIKKILLAVKSAILKKEEAIKPLGEIKTNFNAIVDLLIVKTPYYKEGDFDVNKTLKSMVASVDTTESETTFKGALDYLESRDPDMLCVVRRKRGFFMKIWEKNTILKKDFYSTRPVLVLRGLK